MIEPGLVSITFRQLTPVQIVDLVKQAGLGGIEWGGDVHAPHGDVSRAREIRQLTADAGLTVAAYGSYYRLGHDADSGPFDRVLESAVALSAPAIRVWAGRKGTAEADEDDWQTVIAESRRIADLAAAEKITIVYEFHPNTLTDDNKAARRLLESVAHENVKTYWQPPPFSTVDYNLTGLELVAPWLHNVHVFNWHLETRKRLPLAEASATWRLYLQRVAESGGHHYALLEFVADDDPANFLADAEALKNILSLVNGA